MTRLHPALATGLVFVSGACALVYQTQWTRALRVTFGASTPATAAVLALFMGGLGAGAALLGRRAERARRPLAFYGAVELAVAVTAALSPLLIRVVDAAYRAAGGEPALGSAGAALVRLVLAACAIGVPAVLMGGTLPALVRAATSPDDVHRRVPAVVYGANTLGAVAGCALSTFVLLAELGVRGSIWAAAGLNACVGVAALVLGRARVAAVAPPASTPTTPPRERRLLTAAAFAAGFAFFLLEIVWYRLSAPLLGGSAYSFGVVLAVVLFGIGAGAALFAWAPPRAPSTTLLAITFSLEGLGTLAPFAIGDGVARLTFFLRELGEPSLAVTAGGWTFIAALMALPAALVAGYQLSLIIALRGRADDGVAKDTGDVYAANTAGAVLGSLLGGFVLLPLCTAPELWRFTGAGLALVAAPFVLFGAQRAAVARGVCAVIVLAAIVLASATGPTALWRHTAIGAGRADGHAHSAQELASIEETAARAVVWEREGVEASLAVRGDNGLALFVNGKSDGAAITDAANMIGLAMLPSLLHATTSSAASRRGFVVGLGSGETAGWLAKSPALDAVFVAELEPRVVDYAALVAAENANALDNERLHVLIGDGRELLAESRDRFDVIVSEPSNPYRAGVAGFYTVDFYDDVKAHLAAGGVFGQWLQVYEIDDDAFRTVLATACAVFPALSVWRLESTDALILAGEAPVALDAGRVDDALAQEPWASWALHIARIRGAEGVAAMHVAGRDAACAYANGAAPNTDDRPLLELAAARSVGRMLTSPLLALEAASDRDGARLPRLVEGARPLDPVAVEAQRVRPFVAAGSSRPRRGGADAGVDALARAQEIEGAWARGDLGGAAAAYAREGAALPPYVDATSVVVRAHLAAMSAGTPEERAALEGSLDELAAGGLAGEAAVIRFHARLTDGSPRVLAAFADAVAHLRSDPWIHPTLTTSTLERIAAAELSPDGAREALRVLVTGPFAARIADSTRMRAMHVLAKRAGFPRECLDVYRAVEPHPFVDDDWLSGRDRCERLHGAGDGDAPSSARKP